MTIASRVLVALLLGVAIVALHRLERGVAALVAVAQAVQLEMAVARTDANTLTKSMQDLAITVDANTPPAQRAEAAQRAARKAAEPEEFAP